jgi:hypothetical protein
MEDPSIDATSTPAPAVFNSGASTPKDLFLARNASSGI